MAVATNNIQANAMSQFSPQRHHVRSILQKIHDPDV
jgi:hypothetical protein